MKPIRTDRLTRLAEQRAHDLRWLRDYSKRGADLVVAYMKEQIALPANATPDAYDAVSRAHNRGYVTYTKCNGCDRYVSAVAVVGETPDYESSTAHLCRDCLIEALQLLPEPVEVQP